MLTITRNFINFSPCISETFSFMILVLKMMAHLLYFNASYVYEVFFELLLGLALHFPGEANKTWKLTCSFHHFKFMHKALLLNLCWLTSWWSKDYLLLYVTWKYFVSRVYWAVFLDNKLFLINISYWKRGYMRVRGCIFYRLFFKTNWSILCLLRWPCWAIGYLIKIWDAFFLFQLHCLHF